MFVWRLAVVVFVFFVGGLDLEARDLCVLLRQSWVPLPHQRLLPVQLFHPT